MQIPAANPSNKDVMQLLQALEQRIAQQERRFDQIEKRVELCNRIAHARTINSHAKITVVRQLYPIPLPNSNELPADQFPATNRDFYNLTDQALRSLIVQYELASPNSVPEATNAKRKILADHIGMPF